MWWNIDISTGVFKKIFGFHQLKLGPPSLPIIGSLPFITIKRGLADFAMDSAVRFSIMMCRHKQQQFATESRRLLWVKREQVTYHKQFWNPGDPAQTPFHRVARAPTSCRHQLPEDGKVDILEHEQSNTLTFRGLGLLTCRVQTFLGSSLIRTSSVEGDCLNIIQGDLPEHVFLFLKTKTVKGGGAVSA